MTLQSNSGDAPDVDALADAYISKLRAEIGEDKFKLVAAGSSDADDFCDDNMVLDAAFQSFGIDPLPDMAEGMSQAMSDLWNTVWRRAVAKMRQASALDALSTELNAYLASKGIPPGSADDILATNKTIDADVREWLVDFCKRWDAAQE